MCFALKEQHIIAFVFCPYRAKGRGASSYTQPAGLGYSIPTFQAETAAIPYAIMKNLVNGSVNFS